MKVTCAQLNFTVGALEANTAKIVATLAANQNHDGLVAVSYTHVTRPTKGRV